MEKNNKYEIAIENTLANGLVIYLIVPKYNKRVRKMEYQLITDTLNCTINK